MTKPINEQWTDPKNTQPQCIHGKTTTERCIPCENDIDAGKGTGFTIQAPLSTDRQASHTPGPWSKERIWDTPENRIHARVEGVPMTLAAVFTMRNAGEKEANARLIAAAPELLAALKRLLGTTYPGTEKHHETGCRCVIHEAQMAIAKAEGRDHV